MEKSPRIGPWRANRDLNQLEFDGQPHRLRPRTMDLLIYMAERSGQVLSVDDLVAGVWSGVVVSDNSVYQAISELRSTFEAAGTECPIETIPKRGYRLKGTADSAEGSGTPPRTGSRGRGLTLAAALLVTLTVGAFAIRHSSTETPSEAAMTRDLTAYDEFLRGKDVWLTDPQTALNHLNRAVSIDPDFGLAWLRLAILNSAVALGMTPGDAAVARERADRALGRARELIPGSPLLLEYEGLIAMTEGRWTAASDYYEQARRAEARNPSGQAGGNYDTEFLLRVGRIDEAIVDLERARTVNPLSLDVALMLVLAYGSAGETDAALREADRSLTLEERSLRATATMTYRGLVALGTRDRSAIGKWFGEPREDPASIDPMNPNSVGLTYLDEPDKALEILERSARDLSPVQAIQVATWAAYFGDAKLALDAFSQATRGVQTVAVSHLWLPLFADMRRLPGFTDLLRDLGLVEYWRETGDWSDFCDPVVGNDDFECH